jgi:hypothetical protein
MPEISAIELRRLLMQYLVANPKLMIKNTPLWKWVLWDALDKGIDFHMTAEPTDAEINVLLAEYASRILDGLWGGAIESTLFAHKFKRNVHEFEVKQGGGYERMNMFNYDGMPNTEIVRVVYQNSTHYERLYPDGDLMNSVANEKLQPMYNLLPIIPVLPTQLAANVVTQTARKSVTSLSVKALHNTTEGVHLQPIIVIEV